MVSLGIEAATVIAMLGFLIPLFIAQASKGELNPIACVLSSSLIGGGFLLLLASFLFFRYSKAKFKIRKLFDVIVSLFGRLMCLGGAIAAQFVGECSSLPWLALSSVRVGWFGIALFVLFTLYSVKDVVMLRNDPEEALYGAFEQADDFMKQRFAQTRNDQVIEEIKDSSSGEDIIEAEVVDKED